MGILNLPNVEISATSKEMIAHTTFVTNVQASVSDGSERDASIMIFDFPDAF